MSERRPTYYVEGSVVRKQAALPQREYDPRRQTRRAPRPAAKPQADVRLKARADKALAFNLRYTVFVVFSAVIMLGACIMMLNMEMQISDRQDNIVALENKIEEITNENDAKRVELENMYSLDQIRNIAMNDMGMVYAKKGQIIYYDSANEDYVKQHMDVPETK